MTKKFCGEAMVMILSALALSGQQQTEWMGTSNDSDIVYRVQVFEGLKACDLEYRDRKQGTGYTTFDVNVDYKSTELDSDNHPKAKSETEHIVTAPTHTGSSRISQCTAVVETHVSFVQRH